MKATGFGAQSQRFVLRLEVEVLLRKSLLAKAGTGQHFHPDRDGQTHSLSQ